MDYALTLRISDQPWSGSGDEGTAAFRRSSRLNVLLKGLNDSGQVVEILAPIAGGLPLQLDRAQTYTFPFQTDPLVEITSVSLQLDQAKVDPVKIDSLAVQIVDGLSDSLTVDVDAEVVAARSAAASALAPVAPTLQGLKVNLYDGNDFQSLRSSRVEAQVSIDDAYARLYNQGDADTFSAVVSGELLATTDGRNQWQLRADDGVKIWIGDALVLNAWRDQAAWHSLSVDGLRKDKWYPIRIEYYENSGAAELKLADSARRLLPPSQLRLPPESPWQEINGLYGTLRVDRRGHYVYEPDPFHPELRVLSAGEQLVDSFELQVEGPAAETFLRRIDIPLSGDLYAPLFALDFKHDSYSLDHASKATTFFDSTGEPLLFDRNGFVELQALDLLAGDNDRIQTAYGNVWFHALDSNGVRLPGSITTLDPQLPTFFIVHGFLAGVGDAWLDPLIHGYLNEQGDWRLNPKDRLPWQTQYEPGHGLALSLQDLYRQDANHVAANVVLVDWGNFSGSGPDYLKTASDHVPAVGQAIADFLLQHKIDPATTTLIGHSLGGHISGFAGQAVQRMAAESSFPAGTKLQRIIGMDAAGPLFNSRGPSSRLSPGDAAEVFNLHTSDSFGFDAPLATYDLYVNSKHEIKSPFEYGDMAGLAELGWPAFYGALALNWGFRPDSVSYAYDFTLDDLGNFVNIASGIDSHSYAVAFLAALMHEDLRLTRAGTSDLPPAYELADVDQETSQFYDHYWGKTFGIELQKLQATNDARVSQGLLPMTFASLVLGAAEGGIFAEAKQPSWLPDSDAAVSLNWSQDGQEGFGFLTPDQLMPLGDVPFSDYLVYWDNADGVVDVDLDAYHWLLSPDFESDYLNGWTSYGPAPTLEYGLLKLSQTLSDLWNDENVQSVVETVNQAAVAVDKAAEAVVSAIRSGWRWIFGGPVVHGAVFFDGREYDASGGMILNSNLRPDQNEVQAQTDSIGRYMLGGLDQPALVGNGDNILDYRDGMVVAGAINSDGSISLLDSISGANMDFPLVGLPGGNINLLTTLKYAALLRWRPIWDQALIPVTPEFITNHYASLFPNTPVAFADDSYTPYANLSSTDPAQVAEAIQTLEFTYSNLAVVKVIMELLRSFDLDYGNALAWGDATTLDPGGADRVEITAFSAYGFALGQRFGQNYESLDGSLFNPFDRVGRASVAPQLDLDDRSGLRRTHLRELIKEVLAVYPTVQLLGDAPSDVLEAYSDMRSLAQSQLVDRFIEGRLGGFLDRFSLGLDIVLDAVHTRISTSQKLGSKFMIPGIAGPKRLVLESLAADLVDHALHSSGTPDFLSKYLQSFYAPETIDARDRVNGFLIAISADSSSLQSAASWDPAQGSLLDVHISLSDAEGKPQPAPDQGLAVRLRFGGSMQEGLHYQLPLEVEDRTLYIPGGHVQHRFTIQLAAAEIPLGSSLCIEVLSADSGYAADPFHSVLSVAVPGGTPLDSGMRETFQPFHLVDASKAHSLLLDDQPNSDMGTARLLVADPGQPNVVLRGVNGQADYFLLGIPEYGLPHIENFKPEDHDLILIDRDQFLDLSRVPLITDFNTYAGLVFDLVDAKPLALISDYAPDSGDHAWAGLSSSAGFYRFASDAELLLASGKEFSTDAPPEPQQPERGGVVPEAVKPVGKSEVVVRGEEGELEVRSGEMGLGSGKKDVLRAVVEEGEEWKPVLLSAGRGSDKYGVAMGGMTVIADGAGGKRDVVTGLEGERSGWSWRRIGSKGDVLLEGGEKELGTRVLLLDPLGKGDKRNRIERVEIGGKRMGMKRALSVLEEQDGMSYGELNGSSDGALGEVLGLGEERGREELVDVLSANLQVLEGL